MRYLFLLILFNLFLNSEDSEEWDVTTHKGKYTDVYFTVDEGTWMNLDVSPDGKQIVFDMLGDIFIMPIAGGKAKVLRSGLAWECQPRFSPDGKKVSYTSDAGGGDNIWMMNADGTEPVQITKEDFRLLNNAVWHPDGEHIIARKHFTSTRSAGAGEMWKYHISGGSGIGLTKRKNDQQDVNEPFVSPDGKSLYYSEDMYPGGFFQYNKDPNKQIYVINRYDLETGETETVISGPGGAIRPTVSPDGKYLAFVRRVRTKTVLFLHEFETGMQWPISDKLAKDQTEAWAIFGPYTGFNWTPDSKNIITWGAEGKIHKINIDTKNSEIIPFEVTASHQIANAVFFKQNIDVDKFNPKVIRQYTTSPDGKLAAFNAIGKIWIKELPGGKPYRLTNAKDVLEYEPAFSKDGKRLVYSTWNDEKTGSLVVFDLTTKTATNEFGNGILREPSFSPDGKKILYRKEAGNEYQGFNHSVKPGIYLADITKSKIEPKLIIEDGEYPQFNATGNRIYFATGGYLFGSLAKGFHSVDLTGNDKRTIFNSKYVNRFVVSPDDNWVVFNELHQAYVARMPGAGQAIDLSASTKSIPISQITKDAGINLHWSADSKNVIWTHGNEVFTNNLKDHFAFLNDGKEPEEKELVGNPIGLEVDEYKPTGVVAFTNAKILTVNLNDEVIEKGTVIVRDNKIEKVGGADLSIPDGAKVIDCTGKTIMPGLVDVHAHQGTFRFGQSPQKHWPYFASLAYGITTTHDPSSNSEMIFANAEMIRSGEMVGPRIFSTGVILYGADGDFKAVINSLEDAESHLRRTKSYGAFSVKSYNQPRRNQRQQVMEAARKQEMKVFPEGGSHFYHNMTMILDGHTGVEHNIPVAPLYEDVIHLWSSSGSHNTPTLIVAYGAVTGEYYWYQNTNVWEKDRLLRFTPRAIVDSRARHRTMLPYEEYENGHILISKSLKKLADRGVKINLGSHGQLQGLGAHWEWWMLEQGGMTPQQYIRAATMNGAEYIGMGDYIGSIEEGKLADLIVLDADPSEDIQNSEFIKYTMVGGRLFDAETMEEIGFDAKERNNFWWENDKYGEDFDWHAETNSFMAPRCHCGH